MKEYNLLMDVGGTQIKAGLFDKHGTLSQPIRYYSANATEKKEIIFGIFSNIIREFHDHEKGIEFSGIGMAFPGPFDYENGISLMKGLGKYEDIFGLSIEQEIKGLVPDIDYVSFCFLHDVEAFAIGESWFGQMESAEKRLCLCIGTGAGSAFIRNKKPLKDIEEGVPLNGWLYNTPYQDAVIDEYLSVRGLERLSQRLIGEKLSGEELYKRCLWGDEKAIKVYIEFGTDLRECLKPFLKSFQPHVLVLGGQISKSFPYFGKGVSEECKRLDISVCLEPDTSLRAMQGLWVTMMGGDYVKS